MFLNRLDQDVEISVRPAKGHTAPADTRVVFNADRKAAAARPAP
jgi:hypothetical protein